MASPLKILLFALFVASVVAFYGERFIEVSEEMVASRKVAPQESDDGLVYGDAVMADAGGSVHVPKARDGHYWVTLYVNGTPLRFIVDTGASHVSLSHEDARAAGLDPDSLVYDRIFRTANGDSHKALVRLDRMMLETIQISDITASVSRPGRMHASLLGMNFLDQLSGFKIRDDILILTP